MKNQEKYDGVILIVDDDPMNLSLLIDYLSLLGFDVLSAQDGQDAIQQATERQPDIILLDILMPGINGFDVCIRLKENALTQNIPIIFMTALSGTEDMVRGFDVGGVDYITKPFQQQEVAVRINRHISLQRHHRQLDELNTRKDAFFSIIAHDMRNALVPMIGLSNLLSEDYFDSKTVQSIAKKMDGYVHHAHQLLENLLYWASLRIEKIHVQPERINLHRILLEVRSLLRGHARQKKIMLTDLISPDIFVFADATMIAIVLRNLIMNGLKFTPSDGNVTITATILENDIEISINDTGVGISEEDRSRLFKIEQKFSTADTEGETGSGLGLILCKELVEKNSGSITIDTEVGKGTTCTFTLPKSEPQRHEDA